MNFQPIQEILDKSQASPDVKQQALILGVQIATPLAFTVNKGASFGDGTFLAFLIELLTQLLPILLQLLFPTT